MIKSNHIHFLHIPKTAGKSVAKFLDDHYVYKEDEIMPYRVWNHLCPELPLDFTRYKLSHGHFGYSIVSLLPINTWMMTFLRHPLERTISHYYHMLADVQNGYWNDDNYFWIEKERVSSDLMETLQANQQFFSNYQTRYVYHNLDVKQRIASTTDRYLYDSDPAFLVQPDNIFAVTKDRLCSEFGFVGVVEKMDLSLDILCDMLDLDKKNYIKCNVNTDRPLLDKIDKDVIRYIEEINQHDLALWKHFSDKI